MCESNSKNSKSCIDFVEPWSDQPQTRPIAVRNPQILTFALRRAPRGDGEAGGSPLRPGQNTLRHARVLLVEDDFIVAYDMQMLLQEQGAQVVGPAASLAEARELLSISAPSVAVLDVNLHGELVFPLVEDLRARDIPFIFATAYADDDRLFPACAKDAPRLAKPVLPNLLVGQIAKMLR